MSKAKPRQYGTGSVYRRADGRWLGVIQAGWSQSGTRRVVTVSATTEALCKRKLERKRVEIQTSGLGDGDSRTTVRAWSVTWLEGLQRKARPKYYADEASMVRRWIIPTLGHKRLDALTPADVRTLTTAVRAAGRTTTTAGYAQGCLERMLRAAIIEGHQIQARVLLITAPGKATNDRDRIPLADARALLDAAAARGDSSRWTAALLQGMRQGECLGLTWDAINFDDASIDVSWQLQSLPYNVPRDRGSGFKVPDGYESRRLSGALHLVRPKTERGYRLIPLTPWMAATLTEWRKVAPESPHRLVWPRVDGRPETSPGDREAWYALQDAAKVKHPGGRRYLLHEARHSTATLLLEGGVDPEVIKAIMGHSSIITSRGYMHVSQTLARKALEGVGEQLGLGTA